MIHASVLHEEKEIRYEEIPEAVCGPKDVRVKVMATGICGSDIHKLQTTFKYPLPAVMGHELSGEIIEIGSEVTTTEIGKRVVVMPLVPCRNCDHCEKGQYGMCEQYQMLGSHFQGGFAENLVIDERNVLDIGDMDFEEGAMLEPLAVAMHGVMNIKPVLGEIAVVFGVGMIGLMVIQCLKESGIKNIIAVDIVDEKLEVARQLGCTQTINSLNEDLKEKVLEYTGGNGADIALECAGSKITQEQCLLVTRKQGKVGYLGIAYSDVTLREEAFENIFRRELTLKGFWNAYSAPFPGKEWTDSISLVNSGDIILKPLISHRYPLDQVKEAFDMILNRKENYTKVMILPQEISKEG